MQPDSSDVASTFMKDFIDVYSLLDEVEALDMSLLYQESTHRKQMTDRPTSGLDAILEVSKEMLSPRAGKKDNRRGKDRAEVLRRRQREEEERRRKKMLLMQQQRQQAGGTSSSAAEMDGRALRLQGMSYGEVLQHQGHALRRVREDEIDHHYREKVSGITLADKQAALEDALRPEENKEEDEEDETDPALYLGWREKAQAAADVGHDAGLQEQHSRSRGSSSRPVSEIVQDRCTLFQMLEIIDDCAVQMLEANKALDAKARQNMDLLRARSQRGCDDILATMRALTSQDED